MAGVALILGTLSVLAAIEWVRRLRSSRRSEDLPTRKIRGAAQGYVAFFGVARPADGMQRAPLSGTPCVWWSYKVMEYGDDASSIREETSRSPFYIEDASGRCLVNPHGADVTPSSTKQWYGDPWAQASDKLAAATIRPKHTVESVLHANMRVYVQGEFRTTRTAPQALDRMHQKIAAWLKDPRRRGILDVNRDGQIDDRELSAARRAAMLDARREVGTEIRLEDQVRKPEDGRPFIIAPRVQRAQAHAHRKEALGFLLLAVITGFLCALVLAKGAGVS